MYEHQGRLVIECGLSRVEFDPASGTFDLHYGETVLLTGAAAGAFRRLKKGVVSMVTAGPWQAGGDAGALEVFRLEDWGRVLLRFERSRDDVLVIRAGLVWESDDDPVPVESIVPLKVPPGGVWPGRRSVKDWRVYVHGWQCWTPTGALESRRPADYLLPLFLPKRLQAMVANPTTPVTSDRGAFESEWFSAIADTVIRDSFVVGFTGVSRALSRIAVHTGRKHSLSELEAVALFDGKRPVPGEPLWSEPLAVLPGDLSGRNLERYAEMVASEQGVGEVRRAPAGWCSWYQYFSDISEKQLMLNADDLAGRFSFLDLPLVQIDDGYAPDVGDWLETTDGFPSGMEAVAARIAAKGRLPGIWVAPFTVTRGSKIFREKKEWVQSNRKGKPVLAGYSPDWGGRFYGLDLTHPEVLEWLEEVFSTLAGYGYRFFKLDFMGCGLLEGRRTDDTVTRAEAARGALEIIRKAVGKDAYVMAAGGPVMLGTGILDAQRVSGDVAPFWSKPYQHLIRDRATPGVRNSLVNTLTRAFMSGRLFEGDPDCLLVRTTDSELTLAEKRTLASAIAALGGSFMVSDDTARWGPEQLELLAVALPHAGGTPVCTDIWKREVPMYMRTGMSDAAGDYFLGLAINWSDSVATVGIDPGELDLPEGRWHTCEFWTGSYLGELTGVAAVEGVEPHGCALVRLTKAEDRPRLIGSSINLSQGASELVAFEPSEGGLALELKGPVGGPATVTLSLPGAGEAAASIAGARLEVERLSTSVYRVPFEMSRDGTRIVIEYQR
jgi:alpha-galactosidase